MREVARIEGTPRHKPQSLTADEHQQWLDALDASDLRKRGTYRTYH